MKKLHVSDEELVKSYRNGDETCLKILLIRHKSEIYTSIYYLVKDRYIAEDIFQETFIKIINSLRGGKYTETGKFLPWVMRIARNLTMDYFRKTARTPAIVDSDGKDIFSFIHIAEKNVQDNMEKRETEDKVKTLIEHLPEEQREVLVLRHYAKMSFKEISELTGTNINTALGRMRYALLNLRQLIEQHNIAF